MPDSQNLLKELSTGDSGRKPRCPNSHHWYIHRLSPKQLSGTRPNKAACSFFVSHWPTTCKFAHIPCFLNNIMLWGPDTSRISTSILADVIDINSAQSHAQACGPQQNQAYRRLLGKSQPCSNSRQLVYTSVVLITTSVAIKWRHRVLFCLYNEYEHDSVSLYEVMTQCE